MMKRGFGGMISAFLVVLVGGCDLVLGLERASAIVAPDAGSGAGTTASISSSSSSSGSGSGSGGTGGSTSSSTSGTGGSSIVCIPGQKQCAGDVLQTCDGNGQWDSGVVCHLYCSAGACADPPSCIGLAESCGLPGSNENCCATPLVPQGSYNRSNDANYPATVSDFRLDRFETTVGRFRAFLNAYDASPGSKPKAGDGAHPTVSGSGWDAIWMLPATSGALKTAVKCNPTTQTWTDAVAGNENKPMNCLDWYEAFAFCAWDGGRLPTEAEWNYAAAGGNEQRQYPWSSPPSSITIDGTYAVYNGAPIAPVGSTSAKGDGKWTQAGLAGGVWEWTLDWFAPPYSITPCNDCSLVSLGNGTARIMRGGSWNGDASLLRTSFRSGFDPALHNEGVGVRCARTP